MLKQKAQKMVIRIKSEESQDYVCGTLAISRAEAEELAFVLAASASHEDHFISATIAAAKKLLRTGSSRRECG